MNYETFLVIIDKPELQFLINFQPDAKSPKVKLELDSALSTLILKSGVFIFNKYCLNV